MITLILTGAKGKSLNVEDVTAESDDARGGQTTAVDASGVVIEEGITFKNLRATSGSRTSAPKDSPYP